MMPFELGVPIQLGWAGSVSPTGVQAGIYEEDLFELGRPIAIRPFDPGLGQRPYGPAPGEMPTGWRGGLPPGLQPTRQTPPPGPTYGQQVRSWTQQPQSPFIRKGGYFPPPEYAFVPTLIQASTGFSPWRGPGLSPESQPRPTPSEQIYQQMQAHPSKLRPRRPTGRPMGFMVPTLPAGGAIPFTGV